VTGKTNRRVGTDRISPVLEMMDAIRDLPSEDTGGFFRDPRNVASVESYLRRAL